MTRQQTRKKASHMTQSINRRTFLELVGSGTLLALAGCGSANDASSQAPAAGSAGTADPLNQRSTVGWKAMQTAEILQQAYLYRVECCSAFSPTAKMN